MDLLSPAYGTIVSIDENKETNIVCVSIFINLFDPHNQVVPFDSQVFSIKSFEGSALPAFLKESKRNTYVETIFVPTNCSRQIKVKQMVGFLVRRIINNLTIGQSVKSGEELGHIVFGSRCEIEFSSKDFCLSKDVKTSNHVRAGIDVIATKI